MQKTGYDNSGFQARKVIAQENELDVFQTSNDT